MNPLLEGGVLGKSVKSAPKDKAEVPEEETSDYEVSWKFKALLLYCQDKPFDLVSAVTKFLERKQVFAKKFPTNERFWLFQVLLGLTKSIDRCTVQVRRAIRRPIAKLFAASFGTVYSLTLWSSPRR